MKRHLTATGFVVQDGRTLLHWHRRLGQWMPPGGHLLENEDPASAVLREAYEETGLRVEPLPLARSFAFSYPRQLSAPYAVLLEDSAERGEAHQHIDFIYFCRPLTGAPPRPSVADQELVWATEEQLERDEPLPRAQGETRRLAADVRALALEAIRIEREVRPRP